MTVLPDLFEERNKTVLLCRVFETGGRTYFTLLSDRFITCANKIGSSATRAIFYLRIAQSRLALFNVPIWELYQAKNCNLSPIPNVNTKN